MFLIVVLCISSSIGCIAIYHFVQVVCELRDERELRCASKSKEDNAPRR